MRRRHIEDIRRQIESSIRRFGHTRAMELGAKAESILALGVDAVRVNADRESIVALDMSVVADAAALPFADESFDLILSQFLHCSVRCPGSVAREIARVLSASGLYVCVEHLPSPYRAIRILQLAAEPVGQFALGWCRFAHDNTLSFPRGLFVQECVARFSDWHEPICATYFRKQSDRAGAEG